MSPLFDLDAVRDRHLCGFRPTTFLRNSSNGIPLALPVMRFKTHRGNEHTTWL
jgi:hypothetical protein